MADCEWSPSESAASFWNSAQDFIWPKLLDPTFPGCPSCCQGWHRPPEWQHRWLQPFTVAIHLRTLSLLPRVPVIPRLQPINDCSAICLWVVMETLDSGLWTLTFMTKIWSLRMQHSYYALSHNCLDWLWFIFITIAGHFLNCLTPRCVLWPMD